MRNISSASLAKLSVKTGTEPVVIVECEWNIGQAPAVYGDKRVDGVDPRIIQIANLDDVVNVSKSGTSQSVTLTLDDTDGAMKLIFNNVDIHKKKVSIYQWFTGIPLTEKFLLFSGIIMSPITWKEGDRTLTFTVSSQLDDIEVGFSPEEGEFPNLPQNMVGTTWPLIFGTVAKMPLTRIDDIPYGGGPDNKTGSAADSITTDGTGIQDPALEPAIKDNDNQVGYAASLAQIMFIGYLQASAKARRNGELAEFDDISFGKGKFSSLAKQYLDQGNNYLLQSQRVRRNNGDLKVVQQKQKDQEKQQIGVTNGHAFPQGGQMDVNIGGAKHTGFFNGNTFTIKDRFHPQSEIYEGVVAQDPGSDDTSQPTYGRTTFFYADAGLPLLIGTLTNLVHPEDPSTHTNPQRYIIASTIQVNVNVLYAYRTVNDVRSLYPIPGNYYQIVQLNFGTLPVTMAYFFQPLSSHLALDNKNEGWEDEVFCTCTSPIGPNTVDIIRWLIETYTHHEIDEASFAQVRTYVATYPSHFAVMDRPQVIQLVAQIARQARCIVWLKNNKFYIKYLPRKVAPVAEITEADIIEQTMEISFTETEDVMTKIVASWRADYISKPNLVILRYNVNYYGMHERRDNYFIYNMQQLVEKSATFWLIREANTFKRVSLTVPISKLNIETLDTVTLNFSNNLIATGPIDCIVESSQLDTNDYTIRLVLWAPVRAGEMTEYAFCYPGELTVQYVFPTPDDVKQGRAGGGDSDPNRAVTLPPPVPSNKNINKPFSGDQGNGGSLHVTHRKHTWGADPSYVVDQTPANQTTPDIVQRVDTTGVHTIGEKPAGTTKYQINRTRVRNTPVAFNAASGIIPCKIISKTGDNTYSVNAYFDGLDAAPKEAKNCRVIAVAEGQEFAVGTPCFLIQFTYKDGKGDDQVQNVIQPPVWA